MWKLLFLKHWWEWFFFFWGGGGVNELLGWIAGNKWRVWFLTTHWQMCQCLLATCAWHIGTRERSKRNFQIIVGCSFHPPTFFSTLISFLFISPFLPLFYSFLLLSFHLLLLDETKGNRHGDRCLDRNKKDHRQRSMLRSKQKEIIVGGWCLDRKKKIFARDIRG